MIYKTIILTMLLMPFAAIGNDATDARIQEIEEKLFQKQLELSSLSAVIAEKDNFFVSFKSEFQYVFGLVIDKREKKLEEKNGGETLLQEEKILVYTELTDELMDFYTKLENACENKENITGMLVNGLFQNDEFQSLKFYAVRYVFELEVLKNLVKKYEKLIEELFAIEIELESLKK